MDTERGVPALLRVNFSQKVSARLTQNMRYDIVPCAKPRMTQRDKFARRPCVVKYWAFKDECRLKGVYVPTCGAHIKFTIPMPPSWPKKKKKIYDGAPHTDKPDIDNLLKAILDAVYVDDSIVHDIRVSKWWGAEGQIIVEGA